MKVLMILGSDYEDVEAIAALDACSWTKYRDSMPIIEVAVAAFKNEVSGKFGTLLKSNFVIDENEINAEEFAGLVIPGGFRPAYDEVYCEQVYELIRAFADEGKPIATMCVGSICVARSGVLQNGKATTYEFSRHDNFAMLEEEGCRAAHESVCVSGNIISCSGPLYSEQVMELFVGMLLSEEDAAELKKFRSGISQE